MESLVLAAFSAAFVINGVDELLFNTGKFRGLIALAVSSACVFTTSGYGVAKSVFTSMGGGFMALVITAIIGTAMPKEVVRLSRGLPGRIPPL